MLTSVLPPEGFDGDLVASELLQEEEPEQQRGEDDVGEDEAAAAAEAPVPPLLEQPCAPPPPPVPEVGRRKTQGASWWSICLEAKSRTMPRVSSRQVALVLATTGVSSPGQPSLEPKQPKARPWACCALGSTKEPTGQTRPVIGIAVAGRHLTNGFEPERPWLSVLVDKSSSKWNASKSLVRQQNQMLWLDVYDLAGGRASIGSSGSKPKVLIRDTLCEGRLGGGFLPLASSQTAM